MSDLARMFLPLLAFMLIPLWIPLIAIALGRMQDLVQREPVPVRIDSDRRRADHRRR
jgi:hypothetical protein